MSRTFALLAILGIRTVTPDSVASAQEELPEPTLEEELAAREHPAPRMPVAQIDRRSTLPQGTLQVDLGMEVTGPLASPLELATYAGLAVGILDWLEAGALAAAMQWVPTIEPTSPSLYLLASAQLGSRVSIAPLVRLHVPVQDDERWSGDIQVSLSVEASEWLDVKLAPSLSLPVEEASGASAALPLSATVQLTRELTLEPIVAVALERLSPRFLVALPGQERQRRVTLSAGISAEVTVVSDRAPLVDLGLQFLWPELVVPAERRPTRADSWSLLATASWYVYL